MKKKTGLIHVYTGEGKGKTTAAVGLAARASGQGLKVCYASFHKRPEKYGYCEIQSLEHLGVKILILAKGHPHMDKSLDTEAIKNEVNEGLSLLKGMIEKEDYDMLVMDEILISVRDGYLEEEDLIDFIKGKPYSLELVLTGRGASPTVIEYSHYVTYMQKIKHPFDSGVSSRKGIEF